MNDQTTFGAIAADKTLRLGAVLVLFLLALFLLAGTINAVEDFGTSKDPYFNTITVEGTGEASAVPNIAQISFSVTESKDTVAAAQDEATKKTNAALDYIQSQDIEEKDIKTTGYNVYPKYEYPQPCYSGVCPEIAREPKIIGYEVSQSISVKVRDTAKAGTILQGLGSLEVQNISGPNFVLDDDSAVKDEARAAAIEEAKAKAKALAKELGVHLGRVVSFTEDNGFYGMSEAYGKGGVAMDAAVSSVPPELPAGENETSVTVLITYEIK